MRPSLREEVFGFLKKTIFIVIIDVIVVDIFNKSLEIKKSFYIFLSKFNLFCSFSDEQRHCFDCCPERSHFYSWKLFFCEPTLSYLYTLHDNQKTEEKKVKNNNISLNVYLRYTLSDSFFQDRKCWICSNFIFWYNHGINNLSSVMSHY